MIPRQFSLRILVHSNVVGAIIGRSGSTIKSITQETKARIDVHREDSPEQQEKVITINGSPESCSEACFKILEVVQNELNVMYDSKANSNRDITFKLLASGNLIGRLIGKNGSTIKKIMEQTSTRINISTNSLTESTGEHTIVVVGKLEQVRQAERMISAKLRAAYTSDMNTSLQNISQPPYLFSNVLLPYMPSPYSQNSILASMVNPQAGHSSNSMPRSIPLSTTHHGQMSSPIYTAPNYLPLYSNSNVPPGAPGLMGFNPVAPGFEHERETVYIYIPSTMVGAIIGKSGTAIKEMISTSGASIKVETLPHPSDSQRNEQIQEEARKVEPKPEPIDLTNGETQSTNKKSLSDDPSQQQAASATSPGVLRYRSADPSTRKVTIIGYPASQYHAQYMIYKKVAHESSTREVSLMVEIFIPSEFVGKIIGKGGATVKTLQKQTRTMIRLPEDKKNQSQASDGVAEGAVGGDAVGSGISETCVQITGEFEGSQAAQRHIKSLIRESLVYSRPLKNQHHRNKNESNAGHRNNAQNNCNNNHQPSDNGNVPSPSYDKFTTTGTASNEKSSVHEKFTQSNAAQNLSQRESRSLSCSNDCHPTKQEDTKFNSNSPALSSPTGSSGDPERSRVEDESISNNNTMKNNLNSMTQQQQQHPVKDVRFHADSVRKSDGDSKEYHLENGEAQKVTSC